MKKSQFIRICLATLVIDCYSRSLANFRPNRWLTLDETAIVNYCFCKVGDI
jgi:hypothetical protein